MLSDSGERSGKKGKGPLERRVWRFIREHGLVSGAETLVVGVSGGPDSVCLVHILASLQAQLGIKLWVAHLNHQLRGDDSEADARYVADLASQIGVPATIGYRDVEAYRREKRCSLEEAAREVRYAFLAEVATSVESSRVAVGHTTNDQLETVLMHLIRGSGGLRGMSPTTQWGSLLIVRPLLEVRREETEAYCQLHRLMPRSDSSNLSLSLLRNRIRHELLPLLRSYNPNIDKALLRTTHLLADDLSFLEEEVYQLWGEVVVEEGGTIILDSARVSRLPPALQRRLLRAVVRHLLGNLRDIEATHIEAMRAMTTKPAGKSLSLPRGLVFSTEYGRCLITRDSAPLCPLPTLEGEFPLLIPGETQLPGWQVRAKVVPVEGFASPPQEFRADLDLDRAGSELMVRARRPGDRFQPLGMKQPKKLQDFMVDAKIPRQWRGRVPLVCSPQQVIWVVGWRIDERVKVTDSTRQILCLEFERLV